MTISKNSQRISAVLIGPSKRFLSGISYFTILLSNALSESIDVDVVLFRDMLPKNLFPGWKRVGNDLSNLHFNEGIQVSEVLDWYNPLSWIYGASKCVKHDVIIFQWWTSSVAHMYLAIALFNLKKKPIIIEFHETVDPLEKEIFPLRSYAKITATVLRHLADIYITHSENDRKLVSLHYQIKEDKIRVVPLGLFDQYTVIDRDIAKERLGLKEKKIILFFGLLRPYKGVKYLIRAFEQFPEELLSNSRLLIVGEVWEDYESRQIFENSPRKSHITMVDRYVSDDEISAFFSSADVLVIPYTRASQSGVAHIGMTYGLPIVASKVGGLIESLGAYEGIEFVMPGNILELKEAIIRQMATGKKFPPPEDLKWNYVAELWKSIIMGLVKNNPGQKK